MLRTTLCEGTVPLSLADGNSGGTLEEGKRVSIGINESWLSSVKH